MRLIKFLEAIQSIPPILQGLAAEARKTSSFEEFQRDFLGQIKHGTYWHLTDNPQFTIDPKLGPSDQSSIATGSMDVGKLMITSHLEHWEDFYNTDPNTGERVQIRPYAALIDMSNVPRKAYYQVNRGFGNEFFVSDPSSARMVAVMPIEKAMQYNEQAHSALPQSQQALEQFYQQATGKEQVSASVGSNEGERNSEDDPNLEMNPKKIVPKGSAVADAGTSSGWDWMDATHGYDRGSMNMLEAKLVGPHEGREFGLLISGKKKFAMLSSPELGRSKEKYQKAVQAGKLIYEKWFHDGHPHDFFAIPGEEWRIEKAKEIYQIASATGPYLTREQHIELGRLLGYTDEEINAFLDRIGTPKITETPYRQASASRRGRGREREDYINTYKNPSMRELGTLSKTSAKGDVSAYLVGNDLVAWPSQGAEHDEIASQFKLPNSAIPLSLLVDRGDRSVLAIVTSHSSGTDWHHNHETANAIRSSGYMSGFSDVEVDYYDSDEVGDWEQPASSYSFEDDADEAIGTYKTLGDFDKPSMGFKKQADRRIITNPKLIQRTRDQFARTDHPFNFYFVNFPGYGRHAETGMVGRDWLDKYLTKASKEIPTDNMHVNIIFVGNQAAEWKPMTPWIMAHRIAHAFQRDSGMGKIHSYEEAAQELRRTTNYIFQQAYGKTAIHPQKFAGGYGGEREWEKIRLDQRTFKFFWQNVAIFKSAREGKIRDWFEVIHELFAQYLITGKIKFNPLPKHISKQQAFKHAGIYIGFKGNDQDYEYFNGMMEDLADGLEAYFDNAIGEATGHFFVM